jgi:hypothetical protein
MRKQIKTGKTPLGPPPTSRRWWLTLGSRQGQSLSDQPAFFLYTRFYLNYIPFHFHELIIPIVPC